MLTVNDLDTLSIDIRTEITNKFENNFAKVTTDNIVRALYVLARAENYDKVQIPQEEIAIQLKLSQNRVSELLKLAKRAGLIGINMICRCGDVRNEYTLLDNPIISTIKRIVFKSSKADSKESIELAIEQSMSFYRLAGTQEHILQEVKRRIPVNEFKKASGIFTYFKKTLKTVKRLLEPESTVTYSKKKQGSFCDYEQRPFDPTLENKILGYDDIKEKSVEEQPVEEKSLDYWDDLLDKIEKQSQI